MLANSSDLVEVSCYFVEGLIQLARDVLLDDDLKSFDLDCLFFRQSRQNQHASMKHQLPQRFHGPNPPIRLSRYLL
jgi:hypothetical protein